MHLKFAPRLNIFTGDNGLGKSFVLDLAWWALSGRIQDQGELKRVWKTTLDLLPRPEATAPTIEVTTTRWDSRNTFRYAPRLGRWHLSEGRGSQVQADSRWWGPVLYERIDSGIWLYDPARNEDPLAFTDRQLMDGLRDGDSWLCNGLIQDWVLWQKSGAAEFETLKEVLELLSPAEGEECGEILRPGRPTRVKPTDVRDIPTLALPYGEVPITIASAAMQRILRLAYALIWCWKEHEIACRLTHQQKSSYVCLILDEVESHLHPRWQRRLIASLLRVVDTLTQREVPHVQVLATTHSPLVMASLEPFYKQESDRVFHFDLAPTGAVTLSTPAFRPLGEAGSWLTSEAFGLNSARSYEAERLIEQAKVALQKPELPIETIREIHQKLHAQLKETDPFWKRWLFLAEKHGLVS